MTEAKSKQNSSRRVSRLGGNGNEPKKKSKPGAATDSNQAYAVALKSFQAATLALVRQGPIKNRLSTAFVMYLEYLDAERLPEIIRSDFCELRDGLTCQPPMVIGEDPVRATIRKMSHQDADCCAEQIVLMYDSLVRYGQSV